MKGEKRVRAGVGNVDELAVGREREPVGMMPDVDPSQQLEIRERVGVDVTVYLAAHAKGLSIRRDADAVGGGALEGIPVLLRGGQIRKFDPSNLLALLPIHHIYTWLLERSSPTLVATHTYVNPVVAVLLGWVIAGEPLTMRLVFAAAMILMAVVLINAGSRRPPQTLDISSHQE